MQRFMLTLVFSVVCLGLAGCEVGIGDDGRDDGGQVADSMNALSANALSANALSANALSANALSANALSANALSANALSANALSANGLLDTEEDLALTRYLVRCAFDAGDSLTVEFDGTSHTFHGLLGVAPRWRQRALSRKDRQWMSSCLLAHVNAYEVSVPISVRGSTGDADLVADSGESADYQAYEATFFGSLFDGEQQMYACWGHHPLLANLMAPSRTERICADPVDGAVTECDFIGLGMCADVCDQRHPRTGAWRKCHAPDGERYDATLGVWLRNGW